MSDLDDLARATNPGRGADVQPVPYGRGGGNRAPGPFSNWSTFQVFRVSFTGGLGVALAFMLVAWFDAIVKLIAVGLVVGKAIQSIPQRGPNPFGL